MANTSTVLDSKALRIGYVVSTLGRGGPTRQLLNLASHLNRLGHFVAILTLSPEPEDSLLSSFLDQGIHVASLNFSRAKSIWHGRNQINAWAMMNQIDLIHTQGIRADSMSVGLKFPHVATLRNYPFADYPLLYGRLRGWVMSKIHLQVLRRVSRPVVVSSALASLLQKIGLSFHVVQNGVDIACYSVPASKLRAKEAVGCDKNRLLLLSTGHLIARKDPETIINAFMMLEDADLVLLGDGDIRSKLETRWGSNRSIRFIGRLKEVLPWLHAADAFVSASLSEGLPNAVMEAMACGLPCVLSDIPSHRELLARQPLAGELFEKGNAAMMAEALRRVLKNKDAASVAARTNAVEFFSAKMMAEEYLQLYREELGYDRY